MREAPRHPTYHGQPFLKASHWRWEIILYFWIGGIAGGASFIAAVVSRFGRKEDASVVVAGRYLALLGAVLSPLLLVKDLQVPGRFHHMLRIFKTVSPMSVGSWILLGFGGFSGFAALVQAARDGLLGRGRAAATLARWPAWILDGLGSNFGFFLAGYTGVLLTGTATPLWARARHFLGPLFLLSALSTALAAISLVAGLLLGAPAGTLARLRRTEMLALVSELGLILALLGRLGSTGAPLLAPGRRRWSIFFLLGGLLAPLGLLATAARHGRRLARPLAVASSLLVLAGGLALRSVIVSAGRDSAEDPQALLELESATAAPSRRSDSPLPRRREGV